MPTVRIFEALHILGLGDRLLEPAERLRRHRPVGERDDVGADRVIQLGEQFLAAAVFVPGQQHVGVHAEARAGAPQRQRGLLAVVIDQHAVAAVEHALRDRVEQAEGGHHGAGRQHLDLEVAAGHVVDLLGVIQRVFVENVLRRPGALPAHADRALGLDDGRRGHRRGGARPRPLSESGGASRSCPWLVQSWFSPLWIPVFGGPALIYWRRDKGLRGCLASLFLTAATHATPRRGLRRKAFGARQLLFPVTSEFLLRRDKSILRRR